MLVVHSKKECCSYINKPATYRRCNLEVIRQIGVRNSYNSKILEKYLWLNSHLIKLQFFSMLLYFHRKNEINNISFQVFFKPFVKLLWYQLFCRTPFRTTFRTQWNIHDGAFFAKIVDVNYFRKIVHHRCSAGF